MTTVFVPCRPGWGSVVVLLALVVDEDGCEAVWMWSSGGVSDAPMARA